MTLPGFSFRSTPFYQEASGLWYSDPPPPERVEEEFHVLHSAVNIIHDSGDGLRNWQMTMIVDSTSVTAMEANRGQTGTLVTPRGTFTGCKLSQLRNRQWTADGTLCKFEALFRVGLTA